MTLNVRVDGGPGAGRKRPLLPPAGPWECGCPAGVALGFDVGRPEQRPVERTIRKINPGFLVRCGTCGMTRPPRTKAA